MAVPFSSKQHLLSYTCTVCPWGEFAEIPTPEGSDQNCQNFCFIEVLPLTDDQMSIRDQCAFVYQHLASHVFKCALHIVSFIA